MSCSRMSHSFRKMEWGQVSSWGLMGWLVGQTRVWMVVWGVHRSHRQVGWKLQGSHSSHRVLVIQSIHSSPAQASDH